MESFTPPRPAACFPADRFPPSWGGPGTKSNAVDCRGCCEGNLLDVPAGRAVLALGKGPAPSLCGKLAGRRGCWRRCHVGGRQGNASLKPGGFLPSFGLGKKEQLCPHFH